MKASIIPDDLDATTCVFYFYLNALGGTMGAASVFGLVLGGIEAGIEGGFVGMALGPFIALFVGAVVFANITVIAWSFCLVRYYRVWAIVGGSMTGFVSTIGLLSNIEFATVMLASIMGGAGASFAADRFVHNADFGKRFAIASQNQPCTFRLHEMFSHFTVLTLLTASWVWLYRLATTVG